MASPVNINTLNQFAKGLFANQSDPIADFLAPPVVTGSANFTINDYGQRSSFQVPNTKRPIGGDSTAVLTDGARVSITLNPHALHDIIDQHEIDQASDGVQLMFEARTRNLINQGANGRLSETLTEARAALSANAEVWGASDDPIADIDGYMETIANSIGILPNRVLFSLGAWSIFKNSTAVKNRITAGNPKTKDATVMLNDAGSLFLNPNTQVMLSTAVFDSGKLNATVSKANALSNEVYVFYNADNADMFDGSFAKTFRVRSNPFGGVRTVQKDFGQKLITEWTQDVYVNNTAAGKRLTVTTS